MVKIVAVISAFAVVSAEDCDKAKAASRKYAQCDGYTYHGETCCPEGRRCEFMSAEYSQCSGNFTGGAKAYEQCAGGPDYTGPTFCAKHLKCVKSGPYYSGCEPKKVLTATKTCDKAKAASRTYAQCGGYTYHGETCCPKDRRCEFMSAEYSQCSGNFTGGAKAYEQCAGGPDYTGPTFCAKHLKCVKSGPYYSGCQPTKALTATKGPTPTCDKAKAVSRKYAQCGGFTYKGETCCPKGRGCAYQSAEYFQCKECAKAYGQCAGGPGYNGSTCCSKGFQCKSSGAYYSGCVAKSQSKTVLV